MSDFRRSLDERTIDVVVLGAPDHWHAIPAILACQAGKDVHVEKPDGHNVLESLTMVAAQRKDRRVVQLGTQTRSAPFMFEAIDYLKKGSLGRVRYATQCSLWWKRPGPRWEAQLPGFAATLLRRVPTPSISTSTT